MRPATSIACPVPGICVTAPAAAQTSADPRGFARRLGSRFGLFFDAKTSFDTADASGDLGPAHISAMAKLHPLLLQTGAIFRF